MGHDGTKDEHAQDSADVGAGKIGSFSFQETEHFVRTLWTEQGTYAAAKKKNQKPTAPKFYYLDGPPYTSGHVHIGTAWGKVLRDMLMRHKRMTGHNVWDRAGYDMHGLPTEHATERKLGIHGREQILTYGVESFIDACRTHCVQNMLQMNKVFTDLAVWMDFENAYQSISRDFMDGEWWFIKRAHEQGRLYEGERTMTWDATNATALAKHELEYKNVTEPAIYVRFKVTDTAKATLTASTDADTYLIIWTTTPWTIPLNLAIMANPTVTYVRVRVTFAGNTQQWILAKDLLEDLFTHKLHIEYEVLDEVAGSTLAGMAYEHPFAAQNDIYAQLKSTQPNIHTVILSSEHVDTSAGTGLVHCAPGCGPEDYEVGHRNGIKPFNTVDEQGFCRDLIPFAGLEAKKDDDEFIRLIDEAGALVHQHKYTHDYPHGERSHQPVIYRTTKQWFLKIEDMKDKLIEENNKIAWVPNAAYNAFNSWLENLRDNSISKQRFWGTPLPIWRNVDDQTGKDYLVIGSSEELAKLAGIPQPEDLHIPTVDKIIFMHKGHDGKMHEFRRVPDVLDVWVDAGSASWNCLDYPRRTDLFKEWYPAAFILEGKDQIRGWFNLLHVESMIALGKPAFKAVYMHGFINDSQGRKMSKSLQNYILPDEVTSKYGVDATRYYMLGAANPGLDMNYNFEDLDAKFKNLLVFWNTHKYAIELAQLGDIGIQTPEELDKHTGTKTLGHEEQYIISRLHATIREMTERFGRFALNEVSALIESFLLDVSRTYIQLVRDKATAGDDDEKVVVASTLFHCMLEGMTLLAPIAPYFAEHVYQNLRRAFPARCPEPSIHLREWPTVDKARIHAQLDADMLVTKDCIGAVLAARDKAQLGVRWPVREVRVECSPAHQESLTRMSDLILVQTNLKALTFEPVDVRFTVAPNTKTIGKEFGKETQAVMALIERHERELSQMLADRLPHAVIDGKTIKEEHLTVTRAVPDSWQVGEGSNVRVFLDTTRTRELEREGFAREVIRRIQSMRKTAGLVKTDRIDVEIVATDSLLLEAIEEHKPTIAERTGSTRFALVPTLDQGLPHVNSEKIKGLAFMAGFRVVEE